MQRSLIKYLNAVINNNNPEFRELIKELFDIDNFIGQIIIATHSPSIILDDYKQIERFYSSNRKTKIISGCQLNLDAQLQKHMFLHFPFIKEAFFSRCAIFGEVISEYASFPLFGKKLQIEFDDLGICVLQARGDAIAQLIQLADRFGIHSIGIKDKDDSTEKPILPNLFLTTKRDFEEELVQLIETGKESVLKEILLQFEPLGINTIVQAGALNKHAVKTYKIVSSDFTSNLKLADIAPTDKTTLKAFYVTWLSTKKSYPLGRLIGETLSCEDIPLVYQTIIIEAQKLVTSA